MITHLYNINQLAFSYKACQLASSHQLSYQTTTKICTLGRSYKNNKTMCYSNTLYIVPTIAKARYKNVAQIQIIHVI